MNNIKLTNDMGFTIMEMLIIVGILSVIIVIAGSFSLDFSKRRNIDELTNGVSGNLQLTKLQAGREGVEYRFSVTEDEDENRLDIVRERGNSNNLSTSWTVIGSLQLKVENYVDITLVPTSPMVVNPDGSVTFTPPSINESSFIVKPKNTADFQKCGQVNITRLGHVDIIKGNWDGTDCNIIKDVN